MKNRSVLVGMIIFALLCQLAVIRADADDTCTFMTTANDIPPNIVILLDNGASMEEVVWHSGYDNSVDYTPNPAPAATADIVQNSTGNGFYRLKGYSIKVSGNKYYLVEVPDNLNVANQVYSRIADSGGGSPVWTINSRTITLPGVPSASVDGAGVKDNATNFRFSKNYLNWLFYSGAYGGNGSDLPKQTRFYFAKKALMTIAKMAANQAQLSIYNFTSNASGASNVQPLGMVVNTPLAALPENNTLNSSYVNNINNMGTVIYSPLAEGLASVGGYYSSPSSHVAAYYCQKNFAIVVSPGLSSEDESPAAGSKPSSFSDYDKDNSGIGEGKIKQDGGTVYTIPVNQNGTTYLDDVAYYLYNNDIVGYQPGFQNLSTYTVGFMGGQIENLFLINTSNNGNGNTNLYDTTGKDYGKYHYVAQNPDELAAKLLVAVNDIISQTNSFTAPVVPVTRTTSGDKIYMAFFKPGKSNFWEGNVTKFGLNASLEIVDKDGYPATYPNGAMREDAKPFWQTKDWSTPGKVNYIYNGDRNIYTYLGNTSLTAFNSANITLTHLAVATNPIRDQIINYIRGADVFDENKNLITTENRAVITGDVLHSEPLVFNYNDYGLTHGTYMFFGSNDGMLHAVKDSDGKEAWAFIPPDILPKLKNMVQGSGHQIYVDSSPKIYFNDINKNKVADPGEKIILVCGERKGGSSYFALDVTNPLLPTYLWRIDNANNTTPSPNSIIANLGQSWSEPQFGLVKTSAADTVGTPVFFIGAGYSSNNTSGKAIHAINTLSGQVLKTFTDSAMNCIASNVLAIDENDNGFIDKVYVGDLGGRMWRLGKFTDASNVALVFPGADENINYWAAYNIFVTPSTSAPSTSTPPAPPSQFYYPPSLTMEKDYDLLFFGTGDRENACSVATCTDCVDRFYSLKDKHDSTTRNESNLVNITTSSSLTNTSLDSASMNGWYINLAAGEKVLGENTVYYKVAYFTTFTPTIDPCVPGGDGRVYAMQYKSGGSVIDFDKDGIKDRSVVVGGGIPSKPVMVVTDTLNPAKMLVSIGSGNPDVNSGSFNAGVVSLNPLSPEVNFLYRWWRELTNF